MVEKEGDCFHSIETESEKDKKMNGHSPSAPSGTRRSKSSLRVSLPPEKDEDEYHKGVSDHHALIVAHTDEVKRKSLQLGEPADESTSKSRRSSARHEDSITQDRIDLVTQAIDAEDSGDEDALRSHFEAVGGNKKFIGDIPSAFQFPVHQPHVGPRITGTKIDRSKTADLHAAVEAHHPEAPTDPISQRWLHLPTTKEMDFPLNPITVSGGTAPFFWMPYKTDHVPPYANQDKNYWVAKDLDHAGYETHYYDALRPFVVFSQSENIVKIPASKAADEAYIKYRQRFRMHADKFFSSCPGKMQCQVRIPRDYRNKDKADDLVETERDILVLQNFHHSFRKLRMMDIKIGKVTAVANWCGKSAFRAWRNHQVDGITNSFYEGYRLEGMDGAPSIVNEYISAVQKEPGAWGMVLSKSKVKRLCLQRWHAAEFFTSFLSMRDNPKMASKRAELYVKLSLLSLISEIAKLVHFLLEIEAPQCWVGSSIALGIESNFENGESPADAPPPLVKIFDWGRSEFNTMEHHKGLDEEGQAVRIYYWRMYLQGLIRLLFEASRLFLHRCTMEKVNCVAIALEYMHSMNNLSSEFVALINFDESFNKSIPIGETISIPLRKDDHEFDFTKTPDTTLIGGTKMDEWTVKLKFHAIAKERVSFSVMGLEGPGIARAHHRVRLNAFEAFADAKKFAKSWIHAHEKAPRYEGKMNTQFSGIYGGHANFLNVDQKIKEYPFEFVSGSANAEEGLLHALNFPLSVLKEDKKEFTSVLCRMFPPPFAIHEAREKTLCEWFANQVSGKRCASGWIFRGKNPNKVWWTHAHAPTDYGIL